MTVTVNMPLIRVSQSYFREVSKISQETLKTIAVQGVLMSNAVVINLHCVHFPVVFGVRISHLINILENRPIMLA